jgi:ABC-type transport system involved in cytochrome bd biosynthesis fused ATPase/permease subunit
VFGVEPNGQWTLRMALMQSQLLEGISILAVSLASVVNGIRVAVRGDALFVRFFH